MTAAKLEVIERKRAFFRQYLHDLAVYGALSDLGAMPGALAAELIAACGMRNVLTHLYDVIDLGRVIAAVEPALALYRAYDAWLTAQLPIVDGPRQLPPW